MELNLSCGCGTSMEVLDVSPAQVELFLEMWDSKHPHSEGATLESARRVFYRGDGEGDEE